MRVGDSGARSDVTSLALRVRGTIPWHPLPSAYPPSAHSGATGRTAGDSHEVYGTPPNPCAPPWCCCSLGAFLGQMQLVSRPGTDTAHAWHWQLPHGDGSSPSITATLQLHLGLLPPAPISTTLVDVGGMCGPCCSCRVGCNPSPCPAQVCGGMGVPAAVPCGEGFPWVTLCLQQGTSAGHPL